MPRQTVRSGCKQYDRPFHHATIRQTPSKRISAPKTKWSASCLHGSVLQFSSEEIPSFALADVLWLRCARRRHGGGNRWQMHHGADDASKHAYEC